MRTNSLLRHGVLLTLLLYAVDAVADELYRYRNAEGVLVIDYAVPPEFAGGGYEVLNSSGQVIEVVEAQKSPQEAVVAGGAPGLSAEELEAQARLDQFLSTSYSAPEEIAAARERKLKQLAREIEIVEANLGDTSRQRARELERAANLQRAGQAIPPSVTATLNKMDEQIEQGQQLLTQRRSEYANTAALYDGYDRRFRELKGLPPPVVVEQGTTEADGEDGESSLVDAQSPAPSELPLREKVTAESGSSSAASEKTPPLTATTAPPTAPSAGE